MNLTGQPICIIDLETARSADDCRHCGKDGMEHYADGACEDWTGDRPPDTVHQFAPLGWNNTLALGLSIGCWFDYRDSRPHWFDEHTLEATMRHFVDTQPLLVSFNGIGFDFVLMWGLLRQHADEMLEENIPDMSDEPPGSALARTKRQSTALVELCDAFKALCATSYDILAEIWRVDPDRKFGRSLNSLNALSQANGYGTKEMDGATAPRLWAQGRYAEVLNYCQGDVIKTRQLFEQIVDTGVILRGDRQPILLHNPFDLMEA